MSTIPLSLKAKIVEEIDIGTLTREAMRFRSSGGSDYDFWNGNYSRRYFLSDFFNWDYWFQAASVAEEAFRWGIGEKE